MYEHEGPLPEEIRCFVCLKMTKDYNIVILKIQCKDSIVTAGVAVCQDDFEWTKQNPDAARAVFDLRLQPKDKDD